MDAESTVVSYFVVALSWKDTKEMKEKTDSWKKSHFKRTLCPLTVACCLSGFFKLFLQVRTSVLVVLPHDVHFSVKI